MPIYALGDRVPEVHPTAYVHPEAVLIGSVVVGEEASIWPCAVVRADDNTIRIGARTSVQDGSVLHCTWDLETVIGDECVIGHLVHLEGCVIEDRSLVGNGSIVLHRAIVRSGALVGSNAVVTNNMEVPAGAMALGIPAKIRENAVDPIHIKGAMLSYLHRARLYRDELRRID